MSSPLTMAGATKNGKSTTSSSTQNGTNSNNNSIIQLDTMSLEQLNTIKQREEQRLQALTQRYSVLRQAAARIAASKTAVQELYSVNDDDDNNNDDDTSKAKENLNSTDDKKINYDEKREMDGAVVELDSDPSSASASAATKSKPFLMKDVFIPLTESVYVPGKIKVCRKAATVASKSDDDEAAEEPLLIELGTGYFVEQSSVATIEYLQRKLQLVDANSENGTCFDS
jgi:prefoldin subunit 5